jgi:chorismate dehydratase
MQQYWCHRPIYLQGFPGFEQTIEGATAALVIGDRAIQMLGKYPYAYDLGEAWHRLTGMPFVFAAWLSRERMPLSFVRAFDAAQAGGLARIPALASQEQAAYHPSFSVEEYYTTHIQYRLTALHRRAMLRFLSLL